MTMLCLECRKLGIEVFFFGHVNPWPMGVRKNQHRAVTLELDDDTMFGAEPGGVLQFGLAET
jgi:hypothetical protein